MYLEVERARVTRILAKIKEDEGNVNEAADIMQDLQVTHLELDPVADSRNRNGGIRRIEQTSNT